MCLYPKLIKNRKYIANKKNGGNIPAVSDNRVLYVPIGCQKCIECRKQKAREWNVRLHEEIRHSKNGIFVTLTLSNESFTELSIGERAEGYELDNAIATKAVRRFLERWRKKYKKSVKHFLVTELGHQGTENIHLHGLIWTDHNPDEIKRIWQYGYSWLSTDNNGYVNETTINYITKYITKPDQDHKEYKPIILCSKGIGNGYLCRTDSKNNIYQKEKTKEYYKTRQGKKLALPKYYRNKIYTEEQREKLWLQLLDKEQRFILGEKISVANGDEQYYKILAEARTINKRLGYGDNAINWERKKYERERRNLLHNERKRKRRSED